ncbi:MAG: hypothetical protein AAGF46_12040 [Pseudomonadota bacterium]
MSLKVLAVAVAYRRVGHVLLDGPQLLDWAVTTSVSGNATDLVAFVQEQINELQPGVVVTEKLDDDCKKGKSVRALIHSVAELASHNYVLDVTVPRPRTFPSKYEEAKDLVSRHPELIGYLPERKRRFYEVEPRNMIVFEALALAEAVISGPPEQLAAAMG